jgi:DNA (cytosine-5)-methyltransferase 1
MDLGFVRKNFECVWANDFDNDACDTYAKNLGDSHLHRGDIAKIKVPDKRSIGKVNILIGGFPCQAFSNAGQRKGINDHRGQLYKYCISFINKLEPDFVVFENVRGLMTIQGENGYLLDEILEDLAQSGYTSHLKLLDTSNYGVPQKRIRIIIVAHKTKKNYKFKFPERLEKKNLTLKHVLKIKKHTPNQDQVIRLNPQAHILGDQVPEGGSWKDIPYDNLPERLKKIADNMQKYRWPNFYRRFSRDEIAGTITAAFKPENAGVWHPTLKRPFSVREVARIQSFPDDFIFVSSSIKSAYQMIGNAVPPVLAERIAEAILSSIQGETQPGDYESYKEARKLGLPIRPEGPELVYPCPTDKTFRLVSH